MANDLKRLVQTLDILSSEPNGVTVTELARRLDMSKASSSRFLASLLDLGLVERGITQSYFVGPRLWQWGIQAYRRLRVFEIARPSLIETARTSGLRLFLAVPRGQEVFFLEVVEARLNGVVARPVFRVQPLYTCSAGKAILAFSDGSTIDHVLSHELRAFTPSTIIKGSDLRNELHVIRSKGYAVNRGEYTEDTLGVSVPILDSTGKVVAAVAASCGPEEFASGYEERVAPILLELGATLSVYLGHEVPVPVGG